MARKTKTIPLFRTWLEGRGAIIEPITNEWEDLRFRTSNGIGILYHNKHGYMSHGGDALRCWIAFKDDTAIGNLAPMKGVRGKKTDGEILLLAHRDGWNCFYCEWTLDFGTVTREHLVPVAHGGSDHAGNIVLACVKCNSDMGNLPLIEKLRRRDAVRQEGETKTWAAAWVAVPFKLDNTGKAIQ